MSDDMIPEITITNVKTARTIRVALLAKRTEVTAKAEDFYARWYASGEERETSRYWTMYQEADAEVMELNRIITHIDVEISSLSVLH